MEKLTIKELSQAFANKVPVYGASDIWEITIISNHQVVLFNGKDRQRVYVDDFSSEYSLMLHSLDKLTEEIEHEEEKINVLDEIYFESWMAFGCDIEKEATCIKLISNEDGSEIEISLNKPHCNPEWINDILRKYHFDTSNLIGRGLAVEK